MLALSYAVTATLLGPLAIGSLIALGCIVAVAVYIARLPLAPEPGAPLSPPGAP